MTREDAPSPVVTRTLVDGDGRLFSTAWARWAAPAEVRRLLGRRQDVLLRDGDGDAVVVLSHDRARDWWRHAHHHWAVPGRSSAAPDAAGTVWAGHVYGCDDGRTPRRVLVIETTC